MRALCAVVATLALSGCAVMHPAQENWEIHPISKAGAEVQTARYKKTGVIIITADPTAGGLPTITVGQLEINLTRVPAFPAGFYVPSVTATDTLDATTGAHIGSSLEVGTYLNEPEALGDAGTSEGDAP